MAPSECRLRSALEATVTQSRTRLVFEKTLCTLEISDWALFFLFKNENGFISLSKNLLCCRCCLLIKMKMGLLMC
ncbi:hypothetical protein CICLE_v10033243mg [Citrus x clementina]|uniref:Uncharacterized protein n=1 Tax=Citrus clementina TaxID=85681 RepID=V4SR99_CITCL|nr:hypothetical protein CICLE_v10033243mg [Citrus x clementina]